MSKLTEALTAAAGNAGGDSLYVEDVFSTYLYEGTGSSLAIDNGIDLDGEGGLLWLKGRDAISSNTLFDTETGTGTRLITNATGTYSSTFTSFNSDGFTLSAAQAGELTNASGATYASWTFRKAPGFFDVQKWTGDGTVRQIPHNLGSTPGVIIVKRTDGTSNWYVQHISTGPTKSLFLDTTSAASTRPDWGNTAPTDSVFTVDGTAVTATNYSGFEYVAYIFAHDAQEFGADGDESIINCGSFTTNGSGVATVSLGWEPQYILFKGTENVDNWYLNDSMRGMPVGGSSANLSPNTSGAEVAGGYNTEPNADGFTANPGIGNKPYIYIAIRRPMKVPESGTEVFAAITRTGTGANATITGLGFNPDEIISQTRGLTYGGIWFSRLRGGNQALYPPSTAAEYTSTNCVTEFSTNGYKLGTDGSNQINSNTVTYANWCFKRAPSFMDVVCYTGTGSATTQAHNLGAVPEMMICKRRSTARQWLVYTAPTGNTKGLFLNVDAVPNTFTGYWNDTTPTDSVFTLGNGFDTNSSGDTYVAYLFATLAGVSKVGSYTGTAASLDLDMGFTGGARFFLCKRTDATGDWYTYDSARGIVAGNDPYLLLNTTAAEVTNTDYVDPLAAGLTLTAAGSSTINVSGGSYIFLAIA